MLRTALELYLAAHKREYGDSRIKPKTRWAFDIIEQMLMDNVLFDAFIIERLHLRARNHAENVKNHRTLEVSVLSGVVSEHSRAAQTALPGCGLIGKTVSPEPGLAISDNMDIGGMKISVGDVVVHGSNVGRVVACCVEGQDMFALVGAWRHVSGISPHSSKWRKVGSERAVWRAIHLRECLAWREDSDDMVTVIIM